MFINPDMYNIATLTHGILTNPAVQSDRKIDFRLYTVYFVQYHKINEKVFKCCFSVSLQNTVKSLI